MQNIQMIPENGMCISCGACICACPKNCIRLEKNGFYYFPKIDFSKCISCGRCSQVCPSDIMYESKDCFSVDSILGEYKQILFAKSVDRQILTNAVSGGVITGLINYLLYKRIYDVAICVRSPQRGKMLQSDVIDNVNQLRSTQKSKYLMVSHVNAFNYILNNRDKKVIFVGTGCAVRALLKTINQNKLDRNNYLVLGLFCDKTMHYGVLEYFSTNPYLNPDNKELSSIEFRTKDSGGWPGGIKLIFDDNTEKCFENNERMKVKDYFVPERCLYCLDKLNVGSDITIGDNYIEGNSDRDGACSVIVRTDIGMRIWNLCSDMFIIHKDSKDDLVSSQRLNNKIYNYYNVRIKTGVGLSDIPKRYFRSYKQSLRKITIGNSTKIYTAVSKDISKRNGYRAKLVMRIKQLAKRFLVWVGFGNHS